MRACLVLCVAAALSLGACSSPSTPDAPPSSAAGSSAHPIAAAPSDPTLGSPAWRAWVDKSLDIHPDGEMKPGSPAWARMVQEKLGQEAPQSQPGSVEWQQAVDSLLRTRLPASATSTH